MDLFKNILDKVKTNVFNENPTENIQYKFLSKFEPTATMVTESMQDTSKMYEQKAQEISQWGQNIANKPGYIRLGQMIKTKYPQYASISDEELGQKMLAKYPQYNHIVTGETNALGYGAKTISGIGSMAVSAPGMVTRGSENIGTGLGTVASAQSGQDVAEGLLQASKGGVQAGFGVATGAMPIASTIFGGATGFEPVQQAMGYVGEKAGDISAGTAKFLGGNQAVQEQARGLGEIALPAVALGGLSKGGKYAKPLVQNTGKAIVRGAEVVAPKLTNAIIKTPQTLGKGVTTGAEYSTSLATGLSREAQQTIKSSPNLYKEARLGNITAQGELENFVKATDARLADLSELGKGYESIKLGNKVANVDDITNAYLKATEGVRDTQLTKADRLVLKDANDYMSQLKGQLDETDVLGLRRQLDSIMYDPNTGLKRKISPTGERIVNSMRAEIDKVAKERIPGLKELDAQYGPEVALLKDVKKQIYDANGNIKPTAISTISNIVGKNKDFKLEQFQKIYPELGARIKALKAFEEVQSLGEIKTGSVIRQGGAIATGSAIAPGVGTVIGWLATNPYVVARVLELYGIAKSKISEILKKGAKISPKEAEIVVKAVKGTPKEKMADIINNLSFDPKTNRLTSLTLGPKKLSTMGKMENAKTPKSIIAQESPSPQVKPVEKTVKPKNLTEGKQSATIGDMETKKLIEEARKYKSAEEFVKDNSLKGNRITNNDNLYQKGGYDGVLNIVEDADSVNLTLIELKEKGTGKGTEIIKNLKQYADGKNKKLKIINSSNDKYWDSFKFFERGADGRYVYSPNSKPFLIEGRRGLDYKTPKEMVGKEVSYDGKNYEIINFLYSDESGTLYYKIKGSDGNKIVTPDKLSKKIEGIVQNDKEIISEIIKPKKILGKRISKEDEEHLFKKKNTRK